VIWQSGIQEIIPLSTAEDKAKYFIFSEIAVESVYLCTLLYNVGPNIGFLQEDDMPMYEDNTGKTISLQVRSVLSISTSASN
jgi:hypothetical protein